MSSPVLTPPPSPPRPTRRARWPTVVAVVVLVVAVLAAVASRITLAEYAMTPGDAQPVVPLIHVPPGKGSPVHGRLLLTDVYLTQLTLLNYLSYRLNDDAQIVPADEVVEPGTSAGELVAQGYLEMAQAKADAKAAAFLRLGYRVPERDAGTLIFGVETGSPASTILTVGDVVTAVDGAPTPGVCQFVAALHGLQPGQRARLAVEPVSISADGSVTNGRPVTRSVRLGRRPAGLPASSGCPGVTGASRAYLGASVETQQDYTYPFPVSIDTADIGGPSAGLAMTLGLIDRLYGGDLTGGKVVAATGTMDAQGDVGEVGGVAEKTVAVERAGARVFLVPPGADFAAAESKDVPSLRVYAVTSLSQALSILRGLGGEVPPAPASSGSGSAGTSGDGP